MQWSTFGRREEHQGYCWYALFRGPSMFHWQLNWLRSARGAMVPWLEGFATTVILRPPVLPPEVDLSYLQPGQKLDRDGGNSSTPLSRQRSLAATPKWASTMRRRLIHERHLGVLTAQTRETAIVTITQRQATTTSRNARVTRCLKQDPTRLYKDAPAKALLGKKLFQHAEVHRGDGNLQQKQGVVQPDVCSPLDTGRTTTAVVPYHQHEILPKSVLNLLNSVVQQKSGAERCIRSAPKRKAE